MIVELLQNNWLLILLVIAAIAALCWPSSKTDKPLISSRINYAETAELELIIKEEKENQTEQ